MYLHRRRRYTAICVAKPISRFLLFSTLLIAINVYIALEEGNVRGTWTQSFSQEYEKKDMLPTFMSSRANGE